MDKDELQGKCNLDDEARAELLAYLVVSQLVARSATGDWLSMQHAAETTHLWLHANGGRSGHRERADICEISKQVAVQFLGLPPFAEQKQLVKLFTDNSRLDYRNATVGAIHDVCDDHLARFHGPRLF